MTRTGLSRLAKLEAQRRPTQTQRSRVARFSTDGVLLGDLPKSPFMAVTDHGTDEEWEQCLAAQQRALVSLNHAQ